MQTYCRKRSGLSADCFTRHYASTHLNGVSPGRFGLRKIDYMCTAALMFAANLDTAYVNFALRIKAYAAAPAQLCLFMTSETYTTDSADDNKVCELSLLVRVVQKT